MNFGFAYWGFQGDFRPGSFPDGGATSMWPILRSFQEQGWKTYLMYENRDEIKYSELGSKLFTGPCAQKRHDAYIKAQSTSYPDVFVNQLPELDILLMEWRWIISGISQPYLERQKQLLRHYGNTKTKIFIWDTDHKLTADDERAFPSNVTIVEPSFRPKFLHLPRKTLHYATDISLLAAGHRCVETSFIEQHLMYVGNRYERDEDVDKWLHPISDKVCIEIVGKWEPHDECRTKWPRITFTSRVDASQFSKLIPTSAAVPLLAKKSYHETGLMALRVFETVANGSIPISLNGFTGGHLVSPFFAENAEHLAELVLQMTANKRYDRLSNHMKCIEMLEKFHYTKFFENILKLC